MTFPRAQELSIGPSGEDRRAQGALNLRSRPQAGPAADSSGEKKQCLGLTTWRAWAFLRSRGGNTNTPGRLSAVRRSRFPTLAVGGAGARDCSGSSTSPKIWQNNPTQSTSLAEISDDNQSFRTVDLMWPRAHLKKHNF